MQILNLLSGPLSSTRGHMDGFSISYKNIVLNHRTAIASATVIIFNGKSALNRLCLFGYGSRDRGRIGHAECLFLIVDLICPGEPLSKAKTLKQ